MKTFVNILTSVALFGLIFISCNNNATENPPKDEKSETLSIKDFVLTYGGTWDFTSIPWNTTVLNPDTVFVINSKEEFVGNFPTVTSVPDNFNDYSLLFAYGYTPSNIVKTSHKVVSDDNGTFRLELDIELGAALMPDVWYISVLVPKIPNVSVILITKNLSGVIPEDPNNGFVNPYLEEITGKWKLVSDSLLILKEGIFSEIKLNDYSDKNIIYDFQEGGKLVIEGTAANIFTEGQHTYQYEQLAVCSTCLPVPNFRIDDYAPSFCLALSNSEVMTVPVKKTEQGTVFKWSLIFAKIKVNTTNNRNEGGTEEIPFTEYPIGESCRWANLKYDQKAIIINSRTDVEEYVSCESGGFPEIDFSKQSLLLVSGVSTSGIKQISKLLRQTDQNRYSFDIDITLNMTTEAPRWTVAILTSKIPDDTVISVNVNHRH
jgi:hypothetical protein